jgi:hypothetical protein
VSRTTTLWGYAVLAAAAVAYQAAGLLLHRTPTLGQALQAAKRLPAGRLVLVVAWLWLGWHTFVRGGYG